MAYPGEHRKYRSPLGPAEDTCYHSRGGRADCPGKAVWKGVCVGGPVREYIAGKG